LAVFFDLIIIIASSVLTGVLYHLAIINAVGDVETFLGIGGLTAVNFSAILAARGAYRPQVLANFWKQGRETTTVWLLVFFVLSTVAFSLKISETYSRGATLTFFVFGWFAIILWRLIIARFMAYALATGTFAKRKTILLAEQAQLAGSSVVDDLKRYGYVPERTFEFSPNLVRSAGASSQLSEFINEIVEVCRQLPVECVFLLGSWDNRRFIDRVIEELGVLSVPTYLLPDRNVAHFIGSRIVNIGPTWTAELQRAPLTATEQVCKRAIDLLIAVAALIMLTPMMILVAILIKLNSPGPVLFMQTRNGFNGRPFKIFKFRTMSVLEDGLVIRQATKSDPRTTRLGRVLRRSNIDELPQLFNVIAGDMSLVGPRPHAAVHNSKYEKVIAKYAYRHHVKPGLTGWAQINGLRGETKTIDLMAKRVEYDLWYIKNWSIWLDFRILLHTLIVGLQSTAY
jgi:undecaprenyl-phosphate galactose phosphotransferase/putative colanic acid biosynthesis UDP-glucose lipid carrier transferase